MALTEYRDEMINNYQNYFMVKDKQIAHTILAYKHACKHIAKLDKRFENEKMVEAYFEEKAYRDEKEDNNNYNWALPHTRSEYCNYEQIKTKENKIQKLEKALDYILNYLDKKYLVSDDEGFSRYLQKDVLEEDIKRMLMREREQQ